MKNETHTAVKAIIKKDLRGITGNRQLFATILIVPLALTIIIPSIFVLTLHFVPEETAEFQKLLDMIPAAKHAGSTERSIISMILNYVLPIFFLIIPIMAASVMAASSFVGEKEQHTLETLFYCPLSIRQLFRAKVTASFLLSMIVSFLSFIAMLLVMEIEIYLTTGALLLPHINWLIIMLLVSPAVSLIAILLIVRGSAKSRTVMEAQQKSVFLILPLLFLLVGQFMGVLLVSTWILLVLGILFALLAWLLLKNSLGKFSYEHLLA